MKVKFALAALLLVAAMGLRAELKLGTPFSDNAVLQRGVKVPVWGEATIGKEIEVSFAGRTAKAAVKEDGHWRAYLKPMGASKKNRVMTVKELEPCFFGLFDSVISQVVISNVLVGEVWFSSGQSNMECPINSHNPRYRDAYGILMSSISRNPYIRMAYEKKLWSAEPKEYGTAFWCDVRPENIQRIRDYSGEDLSFSAVAFYYALQLYASLDVPIGIVNACWGGTVVDTWTPRSGYENHPLLKEFADYPVTSKWEQSMSKGVINWCHQQPTTLWNAMVNPWKPYAMRGMIWYQGCSNASEPELYCEKMHALYDGWTREFENKKLELYFAELAPYGQCWFEIQKYQAKFAAEEPHAVMVPTCDIGNLSDIHPSKKEPLSRRLAAAALARVYGFKNVQYEMPTLKSYKIEDGKFYLTFDNVTEWYADNGTYGYGTEGFEVADKNGEYKPAKILNEKTYGGNIVGTELIVAADDVKEPVALRYLASHPYTGTLYTYGSGLPLGPFEIEPPEETDPAGTKIGDALNIPELQGFTPVLQSELPANGAFKAANYSLDKTSEIKDFSKLAYVMELQRPSGLTRYAVCIMDAFAKDPKTLGVPFTSNIFFQAKVGNLTVRSNSPLVKEVTDAKDGNVEIWECDYTHAASLEGVEGSSQVYDSNDKPVFGGGHYGCLQVHSPSAGGTILAYNNFNTEGVTSDIGIGSNQRSSNKDYTFMANARRYSVRRLTILVK